MVPQAAALFCNNQWLPEPARKPGLKDFPRAEITAQRVRPCSRRANNHAGPTGTHWRRRDLVT